MPGYRIKQERITIAGVEDLLVRSLLDRQQFHDPRGHALRQGISSATWPLFGLPWPSGIQLAARLAARVVSAGERILEVGCGLALASLVGHRRGADVTASDHHPLVSRFLRANLRLNGLPPMKYRRGHWGAAPAANGAPGDVKGHFDLIIGSDVLYERDINAGLAGFIGTHAAPAAQVWIVDPDRGNRTAFSREMAARGFALREERLDTHAADGALAFKGRLLVFSQRTDQQPVRAMGTVPA